MTLQQVSCPLPVPKVECRGSWRALGKGGRRWAAVAGGWKRKQDPAPALGHIFGREPAEATLLSLQLGNYQRVASSLALYDPPASLSAELSFWGGQVEKWL